MSVIKITHPTVHEYQIPDPVRNDDMVVLFIQT